MDEKNTIDDDFRFVILENNEKAKKEAFERSIQAREEQKLKLKNARRSTLKKRVIIMAVMAVVAASSIFGYKKITKHQKEQESIELFQDKYGSKLDDIVSRCSDPKNGSIDYIEVASEIKEMAQTDDELDNIIYEFYNIYGKKVGIPIYDGIVSRTIRHFHKDGSDTEFYDDFNDYVREKGFSNIDEYDSSMCDKVIYDYKYGTGEGVKK